jgi:hypothetical protein
MTPSPHALGLTSLHTTAIRRHAHKERLAFSAAASCQISRQRHVLSRPPAFDSPRQWRVKSSSECHPFITSRPRPRLSSTTHALAFGSSCDASSLAHAPDFCAHSPATLSRFELLLTAACRAPVNPRSTRRHCCTDLPAPATYQGSSSSRSYARALNCPSLHSAT